MATAQFIADAEAQEERDEGYIKECKQEIKQCRAYVKECRAYVNECQQHVTTTQKLLEEVCPCKFISCSFFVKDDCIFLQVVVDVTDMSMLLLL